MYMQLIQITEKEPPGQLPNCAKVLSLLSVEYVVAEFLSNPCLLHILVYHFIVSVTLDMATKIVVHYILALATQMIWFLYIDSVEN